jgi:hypothetical protein
MGIKASWPRPCAKTAGESIKAALTTERKIAERSEQGLMEERLLGFHLLRKVSDFDGQLPTATPPVIIQ